MRLTKFGAWAEQRSSKGKIYYYNKETEVSQWAKPREWQEYDEQLQESYRLEQQRLIQYSQMAHSLPPSDFFPPPPFSFPSTGPSSSHMGDYSFPPNVSQPYPTTVTVVPPPPKEHQFAKPALPPSKHTQLSPAVHLESKGVNFHHSNVSSSSRHKNASPTKPHPYAVPTKSSHENMQPCSSKSIPYPPTAGTSPKRSGKKSPVEREAKKREHRSHHRRSRDHHHDDANQPPVKKAREERVPAPDWEQQPWARFYKPDLARKLRKKLHISDSHGLTETRQKSADLEKTLLTQLRSVKLTSARIEIIAHGLALQNMEKMVLQDHQKALQADIMKRREALTELEERQKRAESEKEGLLHLFD